MVANIAEKHKDGREGAREYRGKRFRKVTPGR
jgi:hypothetical protein